MDRWASASRLHPNERLERRDSQVLWHRTFRAGEHITTMPANFVLVLETRLSSTVCFGRF